MYFTFTFTCSFELPAKAVKQDLGHIGLEAAPRKPPDAVDKVYFLNDWQKNVFLVYKL